MAVEKTSIGTGLTSMTFREAVDAWADECEKLRNVQPCTASCGELPQGGSS